MNVPVVLTTVMATRFAPTLLAVSHAHVWLDILDPLAQLTSMNVLWALMVAVLVRFV